MIINDNLVPFLQVIVVVNVAAGVCRSCNPILHAFLLRLFACLVFIHSLMLVHFTRCYK